MSGEKTFTTTEDDLVAGFQLHARLLWNWRAILRGWALFVAALLLIWFSVFECIGWEMLWVPLIATAWMVIGRIASQLIFARVARRSFREMSSFIRPTTMSWDDEGVQFSSERGQSRDGWDSYYAWAVDQRSILLYQAANLFITLPVRDLGADTQLEIVNALQNLGVKERSGR